LDEKQRPKQKNTKPSFDKINMGSYGTTNKKTGKCDDASQDPFVVTGP